MRICQCTAEPCAEVTMWNLRSPLSTCRQPKAIQIPYIQEHEKLLTAETLVHQSADHTTITAVQSTTWLLPFPRVHTHGFRAQAPFNMIAQTVQCMDDCCCRQVTLARACWLGSALISTSRVPEVQGTPAPCLAGLLASGCAWSQQFQKEWLLPSSILPCR